MTFTTEKPKFSVEDFRIAASQYNQELTTASSTRPFCQVINPQRGVPNAPMGFFIPLPQAEAVGFTPGGSWVEHTQTFASGSKEPGFITTAPRFVIIQRSSPEMYETAEIGDRSHTVCRGPAFHKQRGTMVQYTPCRANSTFKIVTRYLLLFLDDDNQPLHETPLQLSATRAFGPAFGEEIASFVVEFTPAYNKLMKREGDLTPLGLSKGVIQMLLGPIDPGKGQAPYTCPVGRFKPLFLETSNDGVEVGETITVSRNHGKRSLELTTALVQEFALFPNSEADQLVTQLVNDNVDFPEPPVREEVEPETQGTPQPVAPAAAQDEFQGAGTFNIAAPTFIDGGKIVIPFESTQGKFNAVFLADKALVDPADLSPLAGETFNVRGVRQGDYLRVDSLKIVDEVPF